jgi:sigma-B regulation protein RsbU (phosphoserine phosphatase)
MEEHLLPTGRSADPASLILSGSPASRMLPLGITFQSPATRAPMRTRAIQGRLLVVDDDESNRDMLGRRLQRDGYTVLTATSGVDALRLLRATPFDLVLLDLIMPGVDGYQVLLKIKANPALREIPVIMLSALDQEVGIARCIEQGAEDYIAKPFSPVFLRARIEASLEKKRLRDQERRTYEALLKSQQHLAAELSEAAAYLRSLLPAPLTGAIETEWCFHPSQELGGDAFGYHWIDDNHFAVYLLDVCGHGVGTALLSVSVLNTLRAHALPSVDFRKPAQVLAALNRAYLMENHNHLYFTIWYGVHRLKERELTYASGGHPPALLFGGTDSQTQSPVALKTPSPAIGCLEEASFVDAVQPVESGARLIVLSDGVFEILRPNEQTDTWNDFFASLSSPEIAGLRPAARLSRAQQLRGGELLEDDFSLVEVRFH